MTKLKDQNFPLHPDRLPEDLAGYQQVMVGETRTDDIVIPDACNWPDEAAFAGPIAAHHMIHHGLIQVGLRDLMRVYRKMPCPKQCDAHNRECTDPQHIGMGLMGCPADPVTGETLKAKTYDDGKPPLAWLPWDGIKEVALVQAYGHSKYKDFNNYRKGMEVSRNLSCAMRHIGAYMEGEDMDPESKRSHLAHAACRILFVLQNLHDKKAIDDRYKRS